MHCANDILQCATMLASGEMFSTVSTAVESGKNVLFVCNERSVEFGLRPQSVLCLRKCVDHSGLKLLQLTDFE